MTTPFFSSQHYLTALVSPFLSHTKTYFDHKLKVNPFGKIEDCNRGNRTVEKLKKALRLQSQTPLNLSCWSICITATEIAIFKTSWIKIKTKENFLGDWRWTLKTLADVLWDFQPFHSRLHSHALFLPLNTGFTYSLRLCSYVALRGQISSEKQPQEESTATRCSMQNTQLISMRSKYNSEVLKWLHNAHWIHCK